MADSTLIELGPDIEMVAGRGMLLVADCDELCVRDAARQGADLVRGHTLELFHCSVLFHHAVKTVE